MEDLTLFFLVGGALILCAQFWIKSPPVYLLSELFGLGGLIAVVNDIKNNLITSDIGAICVLIPVIVLVFSTYNFALYYMPKSRGGRK